jgi:short-subunit dehydrogenase
MHVELKPSGVDVLASAPGPVHSGFASQDDMRMGGSCGSCRRGQSFACGTRWTTVVPGLLFKLLTYLLATLPRTVRTRVMGSAMSGMTKHQKLQTMSVQQRARP